MLHLKGGPLACSTQRQNKSRWFFLMKSIPLATHSQILDKPEPSINISINWRLCMLRVSRNHGWTWRVMRKVQKSTLPSNTSPLRLVPVDTTTTSRELINSWWMKCLPSFCYMLETVLDHQRQSSCSEGKAAIQSRGFSHRRMGPGRVGRPTGLGRKESWVSFALSQDSPGCKW